MRRTWLLFVAVAVALLALGMVVFVVRAKGPQLSAFFHGSSATPPKSETASSSAPPNAVESQQTPRGDVTIDPRRQQLIGVRTVAAIRTSLATTIRTVGSVRAAETRLADVNVKVDGWIRDLYVDYTGQAIAKGQPLFRLYSPDLLATENEYLLALRTRDQLRQSQIADAREREGWDQRHSYPRSDETLHRLVVVALERDGRLETSGVAGPRASAPR